MPQVPIVKPRSQDDVQLASSRLSQPVRGKNPLDSPRAVIATKSQSLSDRPGTQGIKGNGDKSDG
jgi:hypothetical protein